MASLVLHRLDRISGGIEESFGENPYCVLDLHHREHPGRRWPLRECTRQETVRRWLRNRNLFNLIGGCCCCGRSGWCSKAPSPSRQPSHGIRRWWWWFGRIRFFLHHPAWRNVGHRPCISLPSTRCLFLVMLLLLNFMHKGRRSLQERLGLQTIKVGRIIFILIISLLLGLWRKRVLMTHCLHVMTVRRSWESGGSEEGLNNNVGWWGPIWWRRNVIRRVRIRRKKGRRRRRRIRQRRQNLQKWQFWRSILRGFGAGGRRWWWWIRVGGWGGEGVRSGEVLGFGGWRRGGVEREGRWFRVYGRFMQIRVLLLIPGGSQESLVEEGMGIVMRIGIGIVMRIRVMCPPVPVQGSGRAAERLAQRPFGFGSMRMGRHGFGSSSSSQKKFQIAYPSCVTCTILSTPFLSDPRRPWRTTTPLSDRQFGVDWVVGRRRELP